MIKRSWKALAGCVLFAALCSAMPTPAQAQSINEKVAVDTTVPNPCKAGEAVRLTGNLHVVLRVKNTKDGSTVTGHVNAAGLKGEGAPSGLKYTASGTGKIEGSGSTPPATFTVTGKFRLNSQGSADNLKGTATLKINVKADGTYTVTTEALTLDCK